MNNTQLQEFSERRRRLAALAEETGRLVQPLTMESCAAALAQLRRKIDSDAFKIMVMGNFKNGKSTFINALLGSEVLPAYAVPTTAIINEIKYGEEPRAILHFLNPQPEQIYEGLPQEVLAHIQRSGEGQIPPMEVPVDEIEDYVVIPMGMDHKSALRQSPFEKVELFWPLDLLRDGVEIVDSPGLNENPARTRVTLEYLSKADAILFVFSALAMGSAAELAYIEDTLRHNGFEKQSLFCVVNRFDQLTSEREQKRVQAFSKDLLAPYTERVFFTSAYKGLSGKLNGEEEMVQASNIPQVENALTEYLAHERGKLKLAGPARELTRIIRSDALETALPQQRAALSTSLDVFRARCDEARPKIENLREQREIITRKAEAMIANLLPDIKSCAASYFHSLPEQIRGWVNEYKPQTKISALHAKRDSEALTDELVTFLQNKIDSESRAWLSGPFTELVNEKTAVLKSSLEGGMEEFYVSLDAVKLEITGAHPDGAEDLPVWKRVVAVGGGLLMGDVGVAALGAVTGLSADFAKGIALQLGAYIALTFLGILNPVTVVAVIAASLLHGGMKVSEKAQATAKKKVAESFCEEIGKCSSSLVEAVVVGVSESFDRIRDLISHSLDTEIDDMQKQMDSLLLDLEQGEEGVRQKTAQLDEAEEGLKKTADKLESLVFELLQ